MREKFKTAVEYFGKYIAITVIVWAVLVAPVVIGMDSSTFPDSYWASSQSARDSAMVFRWCWIAAIIAILWPILVLMIGYLHECFFPMKTEYIDL